MLKLIKILVIILIPIVLLLSDLAFVFYQEVNKTELDGFFDGEELDDSYSEKEKLHMQEIKELISILKVILIIAAVLLLLFLVLLFNYSRKEFWFSLLIGSGVTLLLCLIFVVLFLIDFNVFFTAFHKLLFRTDSWLLNSSDKLIQLFPQNFFYLAGIKWLLYIIADSLIIGAISFFQLRKRFHFLARK